MCFSMILLIFLGLFPAFLTIKSITSSLYEILNLYGLYLSNTYRLTSNINRALVFKGKQEALLEANWIRGQYKDLVPVKIGITEA